MPGYFDDFWATTQSNPLVARFGASVANQPKVVTGLIGNVYATSLVPTDLTIVAGQGSSPEEILIAAWGACPTATGESLTVANPYLGSQMFDGFGLQIPTAPSPLDTVRIGRTSRTSTRVILHRQGMKQKRQGFLQDIRPLDGVIVKHYGTYAFVDANGVTHQPPGVRDKVVQLPGVGAHIDNDSIKFDENGRMYADFFGSGGNGGGLTGTGTSVNALKAGDGIQIIPGYAPSDGPTVDIEAGGSVPAGTYKWAFCYVIETKRTPLSPGTPGITNIADPTATPPVIAYQEPHLLIPGKPDDVHATALELYRADASVGANGTIQTKFAYTSSPGVLITDPSTGATAVASGSYTGMYQYTVLVSHSGVQAGDDMPYNPLCRVQVGDPPIPYDPRDGSLTTLVESGTGESVFKTSDGGAFNQITGAITYPEDNPLNHSGYRLLTTLTPSHDPQTYIDTSTDAMLGILFVRDPQVISIKPARYTGQPYPGSVPITGTSPPLYELSGIGFNSIDPLFGNDGVYLRTHEGLVLNEQNNIVPFLAATATLPATGVGATALTSIPGYQTPMYDMSSLKLYGGDMNLGMYVDIDGTSITRTATGALQAPGGGGGGGLACDTLLKCHDDSLYIQHYNTANDDQFVWAVSDDRGAATDLANLGGSIATQLGDGITDITDVALGFFRVAYGLSDAMPSRVAPMAELAVDGDGKFTGNMRIGYSFAEDGTKGIGTLYCADRVVFSNEYNYVAGAPGARYFECDLPAVFSNGVDFTSAGVTGITGTTVSGGNPTFITVTAQGVSLTPTADAAAPTTGAHTKGQIICNNVGDFWGCTASGTPGTWAKLN